MCSQICGKRSRQLSAKLRETLEDGFEETLLDKKSKHLYVLYMWSCMCMNTCIYIWSAGGVSAHAYVYIYINLRAGEAVI